MCHMHAGKSLPMRSHSSLMQPDAEPGMVAPLQRARGGNQSERATARQAPHPHALQSGRSSVIAGSPLAALQSVLRFDHVAGGANGGRHA